MIQHSNILSSVVWVLISFKENRAATTIEDKDYLNVALFAHSLKASGANISIVPIQSKAKEMK